MANTVDDPGAGGLSRRDFLAAAAVGVASGADVAQAASPSPATGSGNGTTSPIYRIGILGTAAIAQRALIDPAKGVPEVSIDAVGSRSPADRGLEYARKFGIPRSLDYEALVHDPAIDIVYIALPPSLHAEWTLRAIEAGKHVLCEKPMTSNAAEAAAVARAVRASNRVYMEAYHYPYHPFSKRVRDLLDTRVIGAVSSVDAIFEIPARVVGEDNIRRQFALGGGALMDAGCYALRSLCEFMGDVQKVIVAKCAVDMADPQVDTSMSATLAFAGSRQGKLRTSFLATDKRTMNVVVHGEKGTMTLNDPFVPQSGATVRLEWEGHSYVERADPVPSYNFQLRELVRCIRDGAPVLTSADSGVLLMRTIDAIYSKAGLKPRGTA